jgi:hypothetical protein
MRWAGIDEAGYGPNLGPLVMTAIVAEGPGESAPDVWGDLAKTVSRAGGPPGRLWVDDSKQVYKAGQGGDRLDSAVLALLAATGRPAPKKLSRLYPAFGAGTLADVELDRWLTGADPGYPPLHSRALAERIVATRPLEGAPWNVVDVRSSVVGPSRFNALLASTDSKARVHFASFAGLVAHLVATLPEGDSIAVRSDKHGGRHFYRELLVEAFSGAEIVAGAEGPELSRYELAFPGSRTLTLELVPRADADDGLVALASLASKALRERWMDAFNAFWRARVPGLRPSAGYPVDAGRFRDEIEPHTQGFDPATWWRRR